MEKARHGMTTVFVGVGAAFAVLLVSACADSTGAGGSGGDADPAPTATASPTPSPSPTDEPGGSPSVPPGGLPELADVKIEAGASGRGLPDGVEGTMESPAGVGWAPEAGLLYVVTYGSSSCPTLAEAQATAEGEKVVVALVPPPADRACTMDYAPTTTVVAAPKGVDPGAPVTVALGDKGDVEVEPRPAEAEPGTMAWVLP